MRGIARQWAEVLDKSRNGGGSEPFKGRGGGVAAVLLSGSLITIINGIAR